MQFEWRRDPRRASRPERVQCCQRDSHQRPAPWRPRDHDLPTPCQMSLPPQGDQYRRWDPSFGVRAGAEPVNDDNWFIPYDPGVVTTGQRRDIARTSYELGAVVHQDPQLTLNVVLEVRCLTTLSLGDWLDVIRPAPPGLKNEATNFSASYFDDLGSTIGKLSVFLRTVETP